MNPGLLRHYVAVEQAAESQDAYGQAEKTWSTLFSTWAAVEPINGRELLAAGTMQPLVTHRVRTRYDSRITAKHRIGHDSRTLHISSVINIDERGEELELLCVEVAP